LQSIEIVKALPTSEVGGKLNSMALDYMAYPLVGSREPSLVERTLKQLWMKGANRFSHEYAFEAQLNKQTVGIITCYPVAVMSKLDWSTFYQLMQLRKWGLVRHALLHMKDVWAMVNLQEGKAGEYHIGTLAMLPESRGYGIGTKLIQFAEEQARQQRYHKCSLTVKKENTGALKLYERLGYVTEDSIDKPPFSLYRMVKQLQSAT